MVRFRCLFSLVVILGLNIAVCAGEPFRFPEGQNGKAELKYRNGIPVLIVDGSAKEIGAQMAKLVGKPCARLQTYPKELISHLATPVGMKVLWPIVVKKGFRLLENFPSDYREELEAMIKATGYDRELVVVANTAFDLKQDLGGLFGCSALIVEADRSATRTPIFGRNMDHFSLGYLHEYSLVTVYRQKGKHTFASIGYPGMIGCISGINDAGLTVAVLETTGAPDSEGPVFNEEGVPFALCYRRVLEECTTIQEAENALRKMKRTTTNNLAVCDLSGGAVFEITPSRVVVRKTDKGVGICTNHFCTEELKLAKPKNIFTTLDRFAALEKAQSGETKLGVEEVQKYLHTANQGKLTMQAMVFEPATRTLHLAIMAGEHPATAQKMNQLDLNPLLKPEGR
ncbi:MAG TPA: C45 family peptidase [Gemmataceae bacterium]|jgi:predicted choloylglycine hydrolase|nr:C45 family peptidase [Gemmataceae bacterium]